MVAFASNDYLGLSVHPTVVAAAHEALDRWGAGAGASRLVTGAAPCHEELEAALAAWKGTERAVVFPTGFAANLGVLGAFGDRGVRICSDELNHASIIDGARLARAEVAVYRHRDVEHLDGLLREATGPAIVVTDVVFSMDGDVAPVAEHRRRVPPPRCPARPRRGPRRPRPRPRRRSRRTPTSCGWAPCRRPSDPWAVSWPGPRPFIDLLENRARPYIFTTALTPPDAAAALAALRLSCHRPKGTALRARLAAPCRARVAPGHPSPIIPVILGSRRTGRGGLGRPARPGRVGAGHPPPHGGPGHGPPAASPCRPPTPSDHIALLLEALAARPAVRRPGSAPR